MVIVTFSCIDISTPWNCCSLLESVLDWTSAMIFRIIYLLQADLSLHGYWHIIFQINLLTTIFCSRPKLSDWWHSWYKDRLDTWHDRHPAEGYTIIHTKNGCQWCFIQFYERFGTEMLGSFCNDRQHVRCFRAWSTASNFLQFPSNIHFRPSAHP